MKKNLLLLGALVAALSFGTPSVSFAEPTSEINETVVRNTSTKSVFAVAGDLKNGYYKEISGQFEGQPVHFQLKKTPQYSNVGGLNFETNPIFEISGNFGAQTAKLKVTVEDLIANAGGINVQTGEVYHISGEFAGKSVKLRIDEGEKIDKIGGISVQTEVWRTIKNESDAKLELTMRSVSVIRDMCGMKVEVDRYNTFKGTGQFGKTDFTVRDFTGGDSITIEGTGSSESLALMLALRPFLNI